jgi:glycosyltransferase involved in cell wall biosynthesis
MSSFTIGLLAGLGAVLVVAVIVKWRLRDMPMSVAEKADFLSRRRARMLPALAVIFLLALAYTGPLASAARAVQAILRSVRLGAYTEVVQVPTLTATAALAEPAAPRWELDFAGDGPLEAEVRSEACRLRLTDRVQFLGFCTDVRSRLAAAQIFVLTSRFEAFPYSTLEAMRAGLPVVASGTGGIPEAVDDGRTGFLAAPGDAAGLADRLGKLIASAELRSAMGAAGRRRYLERFTFERMVSATLDIYAEALAARI